VLTSKFQGAPNSVGGGLQANLLVFSFRGNGAFSPAYPISQYSGIASQVTKGPAGLDPNPYEPGLPTAYSSADEGPEVWAWYSYVSVEGNPPTNVWENSTLTWEFDNGANGNDVTGGRWLGGQINGHLTTALGSGGYPAEWTYGIYFELDAGCVNLSHIATNSYGIAGIDMRSSFVPTTTITNAGSIGQSVFPVANAQIFNHSNLFFFDGIHSYPPTSVSCPLNANVISSGTTVAVSVVGASYSSAGTQAGFVTLSAGASIAFANGATITPTTAPIAIRNDAYISFGFDLNVGLGVPSSTMNLTVVGGDFEAPNIIVGDYGRISFNPAKSVQVFYNEGDGTLQYEYNTGTTYVNILTIQNTTGAVFNSNVCYWSETPTYASKPTLTGATTDPVVANIASIGAAYGWWINSTT